MITELDYTGQFWQGLEYNQGQESWLDGSVGNFAWNYAIGQTFEYNLNTNIAKKGILGPPNKIVSRTELYIGNTCEPGCKACPTSDTVC